MNAIQDIYPEQQAITPEFGFLSPDGVSKEDLPDELHCVREAALDLPRTLVTGRLREFLNAIPQVDVVDFCRSASEAQMKLAMVHYTFLIQAYVWGEEEAPGILPSNLAIPAWMIGHALGQPPLLTYSNYVLDNWSRLDPTSPIDLSNIYMPQPFLGGQDEAWFVLIHVAIEAKAGPMLADIPNLMKAAARMDSAQIVNSLAGIANAWDGMNAIFDRMPERCDPYIYFNRVRPWIHGWKDNPSMKNGLVYEGVKDVNGEPQAYRGQTGSQSSIMPTMDALLGVGHAQDPLRIYLDELHRYRPPAHRSFIENVREESQVRTAVRELKSAEVTEAYNSCILKATQFRTRHLEYAASYINKQNRSSNGNNTEVGTGGTPFMKYLKKHRDEAAAHLL
ncbi:MAG: indoleamine 2,3-dioxygenase [Pseudomonadales bacterium]|nr:indoleamine 2,3-dioxygenase [Pseudomonadales bacterium]